MLQTEKKIRAAGLPVAVAAAIKSKYTGWAIAEADKKEPYKQRTIYEADLKNGMKKKAVAFKEDGYPDKSRNFNGCFVTKIIRHPLISFIYKKLLNPV